MSRPIIADAIGKAVTAENPIYAKHQADYLALLRYRMRKAAKGECQASKCHEKAGNLCERHRAQVNLKARERSQRKKEVGK